MKSSGSIALIYCLVLLIACVPESKKTLTEVDIKIADPEFRKIIELQNQEKTDSLLSYFTHPDPTYRYLSARAFASHHDGKALDSLYWLLDDPVIKVRAMAAYAIGQMQNESSESSLIKGFRQKDTMSTDNSANAEILSAIGKLGNAKLSEFMIDAEGYRDSDTLLLEGRMRSFYNFSLRGIHNADITKLAVESVRNPVLSHQIRLSAAHYLARTRDLDIEKVKFQIAEALTQEVDPDIKMALALALRNTNDPEIQTTLLDMLDLQIDYRVKCNIIRALAYYNYIQSAEKITALLRDENVHIAISASQFLKNNGSKDDVPYYRRIANDSIDWRVKASIYSSIFDILPYYYSKTLNATRWQVQQVLSQEEDPQVISAYISALGNDPGSYQTIIDQAEKSDNDKVTTTAVAALNKILAHDNFNGTYQGYIGYHRRKIFDYLLQQLEGSDEGILAEIANGIINEKTQLVPLVDSTTLLFAARDRLQVSKHIETINLLEKAIAKVRGVNTPNLTSPQTPKEINWEILEKNLDNDLAIVKTNKGIFKIKLLIEESPATVINFLELSESDFYDDRIFHRVVPNFVIQTGSPRNDVYGGADYTIRSELGPLYYSEEGYVGMARAEQTDTESTQWFVTHSPTPHLDGKYSIFGKVIEGMDVVHNIQVGDKITDIILTK
ncbi:peptidylprolyl isomerase [Maribacter sp.]|uniref:peptidylprolyl isomerase n=1 Tax=Maribacter sp. TaxID=1897614 RepID=UPI0025C3A5AE|nr:peptidylprolyl isomerase [Maribacter sp.]